MAERAPVASEPPFYDLFGLWLHADAIVKEVEEIDPVVRARAARS